MIEEKSRKWRTPALRWLSPNNYCCLHPGLKQKLTELKNQMSKRDSITYFCRTNEGQPLKQFFEVSIKERQLS